MAQLPNNIFQRFKSTGPIYVPDVIAGGKLSKTFDEPTYLTFRLGFRSANTNVEMTNYDRMPHPLFELYQEDNMDARNYYSSIQYLRDSNEFTRAKMLQDFIEKWNTFLNDYQWSFQSISGLNTILKVDPKRGTRVEKDAKITIKLLESLDWRVTHMLNEYKKIAWDDVYQRWILPDMMRYFMMDIFITEFRTFHQSNFIEPIKRLMPGSEMPELILTAIDDLMPTYVLHCERCQFDITSFNSHFDELNVTGGDEMTEITFDILVGNITEEYRNTLLDYYWTDRIINGLERTQEFDITAGESVEVNKEQTGINTGSNAQNVPYTPIKLSTNDNATYFINQDMDYGDKMHHQSGQPFIESGSLIGSGQNASPTWIGNALKFGQAYGKNLVESFIDKATTANIPGMGISFNEAFTVLQSKDIFSVLGLVKKAVTQSAMNTTPSQYLDDKVIESTFKQVLIGISNSKATTGEGKDLIAAAIKALNNQAIMEKINDFSKATDLISSALGEVNIPNEIENKNTLKDAIMENAAKITSPLVSTNFIFEGLPSSLATQNNIDTEKLYKSEITVTTNQIDRASFSGDSINKAEIEIEKLPIVEVGQATNGKEILSKVEFSSSTISNLELGSIQMPDPGQATNNKEIIPKVDFSVSTISDLESGSIKMPAPGEAENSNSIDGGKLTSNEVPKELIGGAIKMPKPSEILEGTIEKGKFISTGINNTLAGGSLERPEPGEAVDKNKI